MNNWEKLPDTARVWIYQANRVLDPEEQLMILKNGNAFVEQWSAHGTKMEASIEVFHGAFVVIFADEERAKASGCSIDASVHFIQNIGKELNVNFFDRLQVAILKDEEIQVVHSSEIPKAIEEGKLNKADITFNNIVTDLGEFKNAWKIPIERSWLARSL